MKFKRRKPYDADAVMRHRFVASSGNRALLTFMVKNGMLGVDAHWSDTQSDQDMKEASEFVQSVIPDGPKVESKVEEDRLKRHDEFEKLFSQGSRVSDPEPRKN